MNRPTIIDVANNAGVSKSTVSLVLQDSPLVKPKTKERIQATMKELGYVYNRSAANLRMSETALIGLVINDLNNPFFTQFATSLQMELGSRGYAVVIANTNEDTTTQHQVVTAMLEHGVSAIILSPAYGDVAKTLAVIDRTQIPVMQVLRQVSRDTKKYPFIAPNYQQGGRVATRFLLETGAQKIAFLGGLEGMQVTKERFSGYLDVIESEGLSPLVLTGCSSRSFGHTAAAKLFIDHPDCDAVLCFNDLVAFGVINACLETHKEIVKEFQIIGFDDIKESAECWPKLSTVHCAVNKFGTQVSDVVLAWLQHNDIPAATTRTPVKLIQRETTKNIFSP